MDATEIIVMKAVKRAAIRETLNRYMDAVATLCHNISTGYAEVRIIGIDTETDGDITQVIDLSETPAYGSYIDTFVEPDMRIHVPGNPEVLAFWGTGIDDPGLAQPMNEYASMSTTGDAGEYDEWVKDNAAYLYTLDDVAYDLWETIIEDVEHDGRYIIVEEE